MSNTKTANSSRKGMGGPQTHTGKQKSAQNARKHGLTATKQLYLPEEKEEFEQVRDAIYDQYSPQNPLETFIVDKIVAHFWFIQCSLPVRAAAMRDALTNWWVNERIEQDNLNQQQAADHLSVSTVANSYVRTILRYRPYHERSLDAAMKLLKELRNQNYETNSTGAPHPSPPTQSTHPSSNGENPASPPGSGHLGGSPQQKIYETNSRSHNPNNQSNLGRKTGTGSFSSAKRLPVSRFSYRGNSMNEEGHQLRADHEDEYFP